MKTIWMALLAPALFAQSSNYFGVLGGGGVTLPASLTNGVGTVKAGFSPSAAAGILLAQEISSRTGGEVRYDFMLQNPRVTAGGASAGFRGQSHALHYDLMWHTGRRGARVRPYLLAGGGLKYYRGTGAETAYRPLMETAWLTRGAQWKPLAVAGVGIKIALSQRVVLRFEVTDQATPLPEAIITPAPGTSVSGWVHALLPAVTLAWSWR
jgi:hypothetical protein